MSWRRAMSMAGRLAVRGRAGGLDARRAGVGTGSGGPPSSESSSESLQPECRDDGDVAALPSAATASSMEVLKPRDMRAAPGSPFLAWVPAYVFGVQRHKCGRVLASARTQIKKL